jgi:SNF2 family DNA or RNA helicase
LRRLDDQPEWLKGGKLRDYQLEGLNFLVNGYVKSIEICIAEAPYFPVYAYINSFVKTGGGMILMLFLLMKWVWEKLFNQFPCLASFM